MKRAGLFATALSLLLFTTSCGSGSPSSPTPTIAQIAGVWRVTARATSVSSSECVGQLLNAGGLVGSVSNGVAQIAQTGSAVNVTITENDTGAATTYSGTIGASTLALTYQSCNLCVIRNIQCAPGIVRDITPQADSVNASVAGSTMTGTEAATYNVTASNTGAAAGLLVINSSFSATKQ
jgi:hypothetical protein